MNSLPQLKIILCSPRGFCAGVDRAIQIVELALQKYGAPVYVRHEIVHNKYVVDGLKTKGAVFVETLSEIPDTSAPVIFSAHGVAKSIPKAASQRNMFVLDATCPLVWKVHVEAQRLFNEGRQVILIGHQGHPEVIGTMGQLPAGEISLIETESDAKDFQTDNPDNLAFVTQTTLSLDDTAKIIAILKDRFPKIKSTPKEDICYATTNRQEAVKQVAPKVDAMIVVGAPNSSNSMRLVEVAQRSGCTKSVLIQRAQDIIWEDFSSLSSLGITAGASAPETLVEEILDAFAKRFTLEVSNHVSARENIVFNVPKELRNKKND
ncbi:MAG: 4-hydroxy-3-methylbut-2-enyl diphosphate reductase [Devosiaceae bacterium]|nr:4-hydroxy-3-methylbut-2-enyl diphosphate reductase [Devosiaceae bacterium]